MKRLFLTLSIGCITLLAGCDTNSESGSPSTVLKTSYVDSSITNFQNLGWFGARSHSVTDSLSVPNPEDPDSSVSPGAIVLREVFPDAPAATSGFREGDVIVRVAEKWLPIKDDPTPDFLESLESCITAGDATINIGIVRDAEFQTVSMNHGQSSIDEGLPHSVERFRGASSVVLTRLGALQNEDGSFGDSDATLPEKMQLTSLAGLAFLSSGDDQFSGIIDGCKAFVGGSIDGLVSDVEPAATADEKEAADTPGVMRMSMPEVEIDPLTASYVLQFLAETDVQMMQQDWMKRIMGLVGALASSQAESGGWATVDSDSEEPAVDVTGTHVTNQALLAVGAWERKGMMGSPETITRACAFLSQQASVRSGDSMDRRASAALSAGTAAALVAINCQPTDAFLKRMMDQCLARAADVNSSPTLPLPGLLSTALIARGNDNESWIRFHNATKLLLVGAHSPDGTVYDRTSAEHKGLIGMEDNPIWKTAHYALTLTMQGGELTMLTGEATTPMMVVRNSAGEKSDGSASTASMPEGDIPSGAQVMTLDMSDLSGEGSLQDQIKEKLKEMGLPTDNIQMGELPGGEGKDSDKDDK